MGNKIYNQGSVSNDVGKIVHSILEEQVYMKYGNIVYEVYKYSRLLRTDTDIRNSCTFLKFPFICFRHLSF